MSARSIPLAAASRQRPRATVLPLARLEGRRLLRHPLILLAAALLIALDFLSILFLDETDADGYAWSLSVPFMPFAAALLVVVNLAALRGVRNGADELYGSLPTTARTRTAAHLVSLAWALAATALLVALSVLASMSRGGHVPGIFPAITAPAMVALCGALGLALARWLPHPAAGTIGVVGLFVLVSGAAPASESRWGFLVLAFAALALLFGALALLRDRSRLT